jgi:hypothetical protein
MPGSGGVGDRRQPPDYKTSSFVYLPLVYFFPAHFLLSPAPVRFTQPAVWLARWKYGRLISLCGRTLAFYKDVKPSGAFSPPDIRIDDKIEVFS